MKYISLRTIIDDILLLVRNNNISESEDLSRRQIEKWIDGYRRYLWKKRKDELKDKLRQMNPTIEELMELLVDDEYFAIKEIGPMELEPATIYDPDNTLNTKRTIDKLERVFENSPRSILAIHDEDGENIQYMDHIRRHYQKYRRYTFGEMTAYYKDDGHVYVEGLQDEGLLKYIWVLAIFDNDESEDEDEGVDDDDDEEKVKIPAWMVPLIKELIIKNELAFMLNRPSDDSNNATLASVKPHGPQDDEE